MRLYENRPRNSRRRMLSLDRQADASPPFPAKDRTPCRSALGYRAACRRWGCPPGRRRCRRPAPTSRCSGGRGASEVTRTAIEEPRADLRPPGHGLPRQRALGTALLANRDHPAARSERPGPHGAGLRPGEFSRSLVAPTRPAPRRRPRASQRSAGARRALAGPACGPRGHQPQRDGQAVCGPARHTCASQVRNRWSWAPERRSPASGRRSRSARLHPHS